MSEYDWVARLYERDKDKKLPRRGFVVHQCVVKKLAEQKLRQGEETSDRQPKVNDINP